MPKKIAVLGLGWLGLPLAKSLLTNGYEVSGSTTSSEKLMELLNSNLSVRIIKVSKNNLTGNWKNFIDSVDVLIINIPPKRVDKVVEIYPQQIEQIAQRCGDKTKVIFVSSTSVYGNHNREVTETSPTIPTKNSGKAVLAAEKVIQEHFKSNASIVRFGGLFGPERHPGRFLKAGKEISNPGAPINLIHQDDCIALIQAIIEKNCFGEIFNGVADEHPKRGEFYKKAAFVLSLPVPELDSTGETTGKKVSNTKSKSTLGLSYTYSNPLDYLAD